MADRWRLPSTDSIPDCPKCGLSTLPVSTMREDGEESAAEGGALMEYHEAPVPDRQCFDLFQAGRDIREHMCRTCARCGFAWCERVLSEGSIYEGWVEL